MLWQSFVKVTFSIIQNDWREFPRFSWWVLVQWQKLPTLYLHWYSALWCVLRTTYVRLQSVTDQLTMTVEDWMGDGSQCVFQAQVFVSMWLDMFFEWLAELFSIPLDSVLSLCVCEPFSVKTVSCVCTQLQGQKLIVLCCSWERSVVERVKWPQLLFILLPKPLWTCCAPCHLSLTIFPFCSFWVSANTSATQSIRALG